MAASSSWNQCIDVNQELIVLISVCVSVKFIIKVWLALDHKWTDDKHWATDGRVISTGPDGRLTGPQMNEWLSTEPDERVTSTEHQMNGWLALDHMDRWLALDNGWTGD